MEEKGREIPLLFSLREREKRRGERMLLLRSSVSHFSTDQYTERESLLATNSLSFSLLYYLHFSLSQTASFSFVTERIPSQTTGLSLSPDYMDSTYQRHSTQAAFPLLPCKSSRLQMHQGRWTHCEIKLPDLEAKFRISFMLEQQKQHH